jgi:hypothetical protein
LEAVGFSEECSKSDSKTEVIGNDCLLGQIATFQESLHLTYDEVFDKIPYRNLIIMQKDKLRPLYNSEKMVEMSDDDFFREHKETF